MTSLLAIDLAPRFSAAILRAESGRWYSIVSPYDSSPERFVRKVRDAWGVPDVLLVEDVPPGMKNTSVMKAQYQMQGRVLEAFDPYAQGPEHVPIYLIRPHTWQKAMGVSDGRKSLNTKPYKEASQETAGERGWTAPFDYTEYHGKERQERRKSCGDSADAYLLSEWGLGTDLTHFEKFLYHPSAGPPHL